MLLTLRVAAPWRWLGVQLAYPAFLSLRVRFINLSFFSKNDAFGFVRNQGKIFFEKNSSGSWKRKSSNVVTGDDYQTTAKK